MASVVFIITLLCFFSWAPEHKASDDAVPLFLTPLINSDEVETARNLSKVNSTLFSGVDSYSGYITVEEEYNSNLFFWYFPAERKDDDGGTPLLVWLHGGPGASSMYGLFTEAGPLEIKNNNTVKMPVTWYGNYSLLFIDNPVGTGFSFTEDNLGFATNEDTVGSHLLTFMNQFLKLFPTLRTDPMFLVGSSYAGKFIPALAYYIHQYNELNTTSDKINLKGMALGNPWIDPPNTNNRAEWALELGMLDPEQADEVRQHQKAAYQYYTEGKFQQYANETTVGYNIFYEYATVNVYNFLREPEEGLAVSEEFITFLNRSDVQRYIHTGRVAYSAYNATVAEYLDDDNWMTVKPWFEELLEHYGVMCYSGQLDVTIPYSMSVRAYRKMEWSGAEAYRSANRSQIRLSDGKLIGYNKSAGNFMDVLVRNAGHIAIADQPVYIKYILDIFVNKFR